MALGHGIQSVSKSVVDVSKSLESFKNDVNARFDQHEEKNSGVSTHNVHSSDFVDKVATAVAAKNTQLFESAVNRLEKARYGSSLSGEATGQMDFEEPDSAYTSVREDIRGRPTVRVAEFQELPVSVGGGYCYGLNNPGTWNTDLRKTREKEADEVTPKHPELKNLLHLKPPSAST